MNRTIRILLLLAPLLAVPLAQAETTETIELDGLSYEITISAYDPAYEDAREAAFGNWIARRASQLEFNKWVAEGYYPIITEVRPQHHKRRIFLKKKTGFYVRTGRLFKDFAAYHKQYFNRGFELLTLTTFTDQFDQKWYNATWVKHADLEECKKDLEEYGITPAKVVMYELLDTPQIATE